MTEEKEYYLKVTGREVRWLLYGLQYLRKKDGDAFEANVLKQIADQDKARDAPLEFGKAQGRLET